MSDRTADREHDEADPGDAVPWDAVARRLAGEAPAAAGSDVAAWEAAHPAEAARLRALDAAVVRAFELDEAREATDVTPAQVEAALARVHARIAAEGGGAAPRPPLTLAGRPAPAVATPRRRGWPVPALAAAAAVLTVALGGWWLAGRAPGARVVAGVPADVAVAAEHVAPVGRVDSVSLPDGSQVVLAPGSRLAVAAGYGGTHRELRLDGVARFTVRHDAARPFVVRVADAEVRDLGTVFTVRRRVGGDVAVAVTEGVVALRGARAAAADPGVVLDAGDRGTVAADGQVAVERGGAAAEDLGWTEGRLAFRDAPLDEVREGLRRWYGVTLRVDDPALAGRHLTASFQGEPLARVREVLALALGATAELRGDTLVLRRATMARGTAR